MSRQVGRALRAATFCGLASCFLAGLCYATKTDVIILRNGDNITGEIKELRYGKLQYKTDDAGTIYVEWTKIISVTSKQQFVIETEAGLKFFGSIATDSTAADLLIATPSRVVQLSLPTIVEITPIKNTFWSRIDASVSLGVDYTKATNIGKLYLSGETSYRTRKISTSLSLASNFTAQKGQDTATRNSLSSTTLRFYENSWTVGGTATIEENSELGIDARLLVGLGGGSSFIYTNEQHAGALAGLQWNQEKGSQGGNDQGNLEGFLTVAYEKYRFDTPKLNLTTGGSVFPNLTPVGRVRAEYKINFKWEIVADFFWNLDFYFQYDSEPPTEGASKEDYGTVVSFGWST